MEEGSKNPVQTQNTQSSSPHLLSCLGYTNTHPLNSQPHSVPNQLAPCRAENSPQLLSPSLSCTLMKFSIQKGSQMQRFVNESQWPCSEQFNWHAGSSGKGTKATGFRAGGEDSFTAASSRASVKAPRSVACGDVS